ncbi:MAG: pilus assembly protein N-terminal domain-containing protein [Deltaproteobacteria bacterium]|nr:pilus assembly protein N-terminal domain-containing protein [Deltaproteobacteria bacterium]
MRPVMRPVVREVARLSVVLAALLAVPAVPDVAYAQKKGAAAKEKEPPPPTENQELNLAVGENKTIPANDVKNYSEGTPGVVDIKLTTDASAFVVVGLKAGSTSLLLIKKNGQEVTWTINVFARSPAIVENELKQLLEGYTGVKVRRVGSRLFIEGSVASENDVKRIAQIASVYGGQVESLVGVGATKDRTNIRIDFFFVQYTKDSGYQLGISYPGRIGGEVIQSNIGYDFVTGTTSAVTNVVNQPLPGLDIASRFGWAKVLKQATVITTNGADAVLDAGGEQNYPIAAGITSSVMKITFGTVLTVQPFFDPVSREVEIKVQADVADLMPPGRGTSIPSRNVTKVQTVVHMRLGQSLVLSGFRFENERKSVEGLPLLKDIPIIGVLFGSQKFETQESEGAVFLVPSVVEPSNKPAIDFVNETLKVYEDWSGSPVTGTPMPSVYDKAPNKFVPSELPEPAPTPKKK